MSFWSVISAPFASREKGLTPMSSLKLALALACGLVVGATVAFAQEILDQEPPYSALKAGDCVLVRPSKGTCPKAYEMCQLKANSPDRSRKCRWDIK